MKPIGMLLSTATVLVLSVLASAGDAKDGTVYELRTYIPAPGKMDELNARFRNHTNKLFEKHGMKLVGYWTLADDKAKPKLIYILAHKSMAAAEKSWKDFGSDDEWKKVKTETEKNGKLVAGVERVYMKATDYSPLK